MRWALPLICVLGLAGCVSTESRTPPHVDAMFRETGAGLGGTLTLTKPALVAEVNGAYRIHSASYRTRARLGPNGHIEAGANAVFALEFRDFGDIAVLQVDDKDVSLRAELGPGGTVVNALLGAENGRVHDGFASFGNDAFESGGYQMIYDGPDVVVGRLDLKFKKYSVAVNFRAPRLGR